MDDAAEVLNNYLVNACDSCMPRRVYGAHKRKAVHWWNHEIADLRAKCIRNRRIYLRVVKRHGPEGSTAERIAFREARKALRVSIRKSQKLSLDSEADRSDGQQPNGGLEVPQGQKTPAGSRPGQGMSQPTRASLPPLDAPIPAKIHCALLEKDSVIS